MISLLLDFFLLTCSCPPRLFPSFPTRRSSDLVDTAAILMRRGIPIHGVHVGQEDIPVAAVRELLGPDAIIGLTTRSEEHTSELQSRGHLVCRLLLEKKKKNQEKIQLLDQMHDT